MNKHRDIQEYKNTVRENEDFFGNYYYHALIDLNLIKLDGILAHGILSKQGIEDNMLPSIYTHHACSFDSKNGDTFVSLSQYPGDCQFNQLFESFSMHTLTSVSLLVSKDIPVQKIGTRETFFEDELFCFRKIDKSFLEGILLPEHLSNQPISQINCLPNDLACYTRSYINHWLSVTEHYFEHNIPQNYLEKLKKSFDSFWDIIERYDNPNNWIEAAIETQKLECGKDLKDILASILEYCWSLKLQQENLTYMDIVQNLNKEHLPIYEIQEKYLKRI